MSLFPTTKILPPDDIIGREALIRDVTRRTYTNARLSTPYNGKVM